MLDQEGYILTNFHCIGYPTSGPKDEDLESLGLKPGDLFNSKGLSVVAVTDDPRRLPKPTYVAQVMSHDPELDLAVLKIIAYYNSKQKLTDTLPVITMDMADSESVQTLDDVIVVGYPGIAGDTVTATEGRISGFIDENGDGDFDWFKTDVLVNQGNSGGLRAQCTGRTDRRSHRSAAGQVGQRDLPRPARKPRVVLYRGSPEGGRERRTGHHEAAQQSNEASGQADGEGHVRRDRIWHGIRRERWYRRRSDDLQFGHQGSPRRPAIREHARWDGLGLHLAVCRARMSPGNPTCSGNSASLASRT